MAPIRLSVDYRYPIDEVWESITDPAAMHQWMADNDFRPVEGHEFMFRMPPKPGYDQIVRCRVERIDPPRELAYTWLTGWLHEPSTVTWRLRPYGEGTRLELEHAGLQKGIAGWLVKRALRAGWTQTLHEGLPRTIEDRRAGA